MALVGTRNVRFPGTPILVILPYQGTGSTSRTSPIHCAKAAQRRISRFLLVIEVHIPAPVHAAGTDQETPFDNQVLRQGMWLCGRNPASKSVRKSSLGKSYKKLIVHNYSALLYTYLRLVNSEGMLEHSVFEVRKLNARLNKNLDNYYGRGHNMPTEQNPEIYRTIKALTEIGEGYCQRVNERFAVLPD